MDWTQIVLAIISLVSTGGAAGFYAAWRKGRLDDKKSRQDDQVFQADQYRTLLEVERNARKLMIDEWQEAQKRQQQRIQDLEDAIASLREDYEKVIASNIKLKGELFRCQQTH